MQANVLSALLHLRDFSDRHSGGSSSSSGSAIRSTSGRRVLRRSSGSSGRLARLDPARLLVHILHLLGHLCPESYDLSTDSGFPDFAVVLGTQNT